MSPEVARPPVVRTYRPGLFVCGVSTYVAFPLLLGIERLAAWPLQSTTGGHLLAAHTERRFAERDFWKLRRATPA